MLPKSYLASEKPFVCDVCSEAVTNPICPMCLTTSVEAWLTLYPDLGEDLLPRIKGYLRKLGMRVEESTECIRCRNKRASVCPYCFTEFIIHELKKSQANRIVLKEFIEFFNFRNQVPSPHAKKWGYKQVL